jgi:plasmid maintenance system antidote protein VapI
MLVHPEEVLLEEFPKPMNLSQNQMALALRLARYFDMSPRFWLGLQMDYNLDVVEDEIGEQLNKEVVALGSKEK